jgi:hypothetical protein
MSTNQLHGKTFEGEVIKKCFGVPEEQVESFKSTAAFDIPLGVVTCQHPTGDPVSIKTAAVKAALQSASVSLSDASRVWAWDRALILVVGLYAQVGGDKIFHTVYEFHFRLSANERFRLYGTLTHEEVLNFHKKLKTFGVGSHGAARVWAKAQKELLSSKVGAIQLNPKIDTKSQRRLQCSAKLAGLVDACENTICFSDKETGTYRGLPLPYAVKSSARQFS